MAATARISQSGAWYGRTETHYTTRGAECWHGAGGWYARCGARIRGPLSSLPAALEAADRMLDAARQQGPGDG